MDTNLLLWIGQVTLALAFAFIAYGHALAFDSWSEQPGRTWLKAVGRDRMRTIGILEGLGAIGLVLPAATKVLPWLTPLAAACFVLLMVFAIIFHLRRQGEIPNVLFNLMLGTFAALIAYGRFVIEPI